MHKVMILKDMEIYVFIFIFIPKSHFLRDFDVFSDLSILANFNANFIDFSCG